MPTDNVPNTQSAHEAALTVSSQKHDLARQIVSAKQDTSGGIVAQLSNNPFFTAVLLPMYLRYMDVANSYRALV